MRTANVRTTTASDGVTLSYRDIGDGAAAGTAVVLVHGWMVSGRVWDAMLDELGDRRVVVPDMRGAGASARGTACDLDQLAADVLRVADAAGLDRFDLVGHSMGGQIAALVAAVAPSRVRTLALVTPVPLAGLALPDEVAGMFRTSGGNRDAQGRILDMACKELGAAARERLLDDAGRIAPDVIADVLGVWTRGGDGARSGSIACPTLVVATDDPFLPVDFLRSAVAASIPRSRLEVLPGPGHYPQVERPRETLSILARHWEAGA